MNILLKRLLFLLIAAAVYRLGVHIPVPGIQPDQLNNLFTGSGSSFLGLFNLFSGGALRNFSILALGIVPYISASIVMQLMQGVLPSLRQLRREGDKGRRVLVNYTRYLTLLLAIVESTGLALAMYRNDVFIPDNALIFGVLSVVSMATGVMFLVWLGEEISERGIGNGMSMLIFFSIVSSLPRSMVTLVEQAREGSLNVLNLVLVVVILVLLTLGIVIIERGQRRVSITHANRNPMQGGRSANTYFPLKINMAGVIPAIFASSLLLAPYSILQWTGTAGSNWLQSVALVLTPGQPLYMVLFVAAVFFFSFFYASLVFNPREVADNLKRSGAFIPGIRPGNATTEFFAKTVARLTLIGAGYIAIISLTPQFISMITGSSFLFAGTSVLIVVVVVMDFMAQIQNYLFSAQYASVFAKANLKNYGR